MRSRPSSTGAPAIATLKCLGAPSRTVFGIYLTEILIVALLGHRHRAGRRRRGAASGAVLLARIIPLPISDRIEALPLLIAAALTACW